MNNFRKIFAINSSMMWFNVSPLPKSTKIDQNHSQTSFSFVFFLFSCCRIPTVGGGIPISIWLHKPMLNSPVWFDTYNFAVRTTHDDDDSMRIELNTNSRHKKKSSWKKRKQSRPMPAKIERTPVQWMKGKKERKNHEKKTKKTHERTKGPNSKFYYKFYLWLFASHTLIVRRRYSSSSSCWMYVPKQTKRHKWKRREERNYINNNNNCSEMPAQIIYD